MTAEDLKFWVDTLDLGAQALKSARE